MTLDKIEKLQVIGFVFRMSDQQILSAGKRDGRALDDESSSDDEDETRPQAFNGARAARFPWERYQLHNHFS